MKKKVFRRIKKLFKFVIIIAIFGVFYSFAFSTYENIKINKMKNDFKDRAITYEEIELNYPQNLTDNTHIRRYWSVPRETSEEFDGLNVYQDNAKNFLGRKADIFATQTSPFPNVFGFHQFMSYYFGGHAAIYDGSVFYEATGYPDSIGEFFDTVGNKGDSPDHGLSPYASLNYSNYWTNPSKYNNYYNMYYREEFIGLRIKGMDSEMADALITSANEKIEEKRLYNFLFFLNMKNKYYCTDFVSRSYSDAHHRVIKNDPDYRNKGYATKLNDDGFITSVNDLILSKDTYIAFYFELTEEDGVIVENYYYLEDIE